MILFLPCEQWGRLMVFSFVCPSVQTTHLFKAWHLNTVGQFHEIWCRYSGLTGKWFLICFVLLSKFLTGLLLGRTFPLLKRNFIDFTHRSLFQVLGVRLHLWKSCINLNDNNALGDVTWVSVGFEMGGFNTHKQHNWQRNIISDDFCCTDFENYNQPSKWRLLSLWLLSRQAVNAAEIWRGGRWVLSSMAGELVIFFTERVRMAMSLICSLFEAGQISIPSTLCTETAGNTQARWWMRISQKNNKQVKFRIRDSPSNVETAEC